MRDAYYLCISEELGTRMVDCPAKLSINLVPTLKEVVGFFVYAVYRDGQKELIVALDNLSMRKDVLVDGMSWNSSREKVGSIAIEGGYCNETIRYRVKEEVVDGSSILDEADGEVSDLGVVESSNRPMLDRSLERISNTIVAEAAQMSSLGSALEYIAHAYQRAEESVAATAAGSSTVRTGNGVVSASSNSDTDKRNIIQKFLDWITFQQPTEFETTTHDQEKAADALMKKQLRTVLQDEKNSENHWDRASVDERKRILEDYMGEVIKIYGVKGVKTPINWDSNATYTKEEILWGYYSHDYHTVTLNESALTDNVKNWDSYNLIATVSHELRHAYQHEAVDNPTEYMVSSETIASWKDNLAPGHDGEEALEMLAENGTTYRIFLTVNGSVDAVQNASTGEWPMKSAR